MTMNKTSLWLGSSLLALAVLPSSAFAQSAPASDAEARVEEVVVTGSRITRNGYSAPTPLTVASSEQINATATPNIAQYLNTLPAFAGSIQAASNQTGVGNGRSGANALNLRGLGLARTLVLLDGQRVVPSLISGAVDIDGFPQQLISRVEIVTGGASSVYGSDAVAGVVNFILDRKFTGLKGEVSGGISTYGDAENTKVALSAGKAFAGGRGHILLSGEHVKDQGVLDGVGDRTWNRDGYQVIQNPAYTATNGQPLNLLLRNVGVSNASYGGLVTTGPLMGTGFGAGGTPYQQVYGDIVSNPFMRGGDWALNEPQLTDLTALAPRERRSNLFGRLSFDVTDDVTVFGQYSWAKSNILGKGSPANMLGAAGPLIRADNPFIPASVRARMTATQTLQIGTFNQDLGPIFSANERELTRYVLGADGRFEGVGGDWKWSAYYQRGVSDNFAQAIGNVDRAKYRLATDAVVAPAGIAGIQAGATVCRSTLTAPTNGCVPYNAMGVGVNTEAAIAYVHGNSQQTLRQKQSVWAGTLQGEPLSTWAGPVSVALSAEHREESIRAVADPTSLAAGWLAANFGNINGSYKVTEGAAETLIPLARDMAWARSWDLSAAVRRTDYSTSGQVTTWKVGSVYEPFDGLKLRATRSRDIRAPNLNELYAGGTTSAGNFVDPATNTGISVLFTVSGNPLLKPEKADGLTVGAVWQPTFAPGFSVSVDYWEVSVDDGIAATGANDILRQCFLGDQVYCNQITRTNGVITAIRGGSFNQAGQDVRGVDIEASYRFDLDKILAKAPGTVTLHTNITRYLENRTDNGLTPNTVIDSLGLQPMKFNAITTLGYELDTLRVSLTARNSGSGQFNPDGIECTSGCPTSTLANPTYNYNHLPGFFYVDAALSYGFSIKGVADQAEVFLNVRNLFNKDPAEVPNANQFFVPRTNSTAVGGRYDALGRLFRAGVRFRM